MKLSPLFKNCLIEIHKSSFTAMSSVDEKDQIEKATIISVGDEVTAVKEGDVIIFKDFELDVIDLDGKKYYIINEDAIKCLVTNTTL